MMNNSIISVIGSGTMGNGIAHVFSMSSQVKQVILIDFFNRFVQKADFFSITPSSHFDLVVNFTQIISMQWLPSFKHDVVGNIYNYII